MAKRILLTGCAGFIGWKTSELLLDRGDLVVGIDEMNSYYDVKLKEWRLSQLLSNPNFTFYRGDIARRDFVEGVFSAHGIDAVVNLAARAGVRYSLVDPYVYLRTNAEGTLVLLECCRRFGVKKFLLASTSSLYAGSPMPFREDLPVNEPLSPYAASKKAAEAMCYSYHYLYGIDVTVTRYFTVYGPAGRPDMSIFRFIKYVDEGVPLVIYGDGSQSRDFTYVDDIARGTVAALREVGYQVINLGNNRPHGLMEALSLVEEFLGKKAEIVYKPFHKADMKATWAEIGKARELLGWSPQVDLAEGIRRSVDWYRENRGWLKNVSCEEGDRKEEVKDV